MAAPVSELSRVLTNLANSANTQKGNYWAQKQLIVGVDDEVLIIDNEDRLIPVPFVDDKGATHRLAVDFKKYYVDMKPEQPTFDHVWTSLMVMADGSILTDPTLPKTYGQCISRKPIKSGTALEDAAAARFVKQLEDAGKPIPDTAGQIKYIINDPNRLSIWDKAVELAFDKGRFIPEITSDDVRYEAKQAVDGGVDASKLGKVNYHTSATAWSAPPLQAHRCERQRPPLFCPSAARLPKTRKC
jgi:hypothetical protein